MQEGLVSLFDRKCSFLLFGFLDKGIGIHGLGLNLFLPGMETVEQLLGECGFGLRKILALTQVFGELV